MSQARWKQVRALLEAALDVPESKRPAFLERACGSDAGLRDEVASRMAREKEAERFPDQPAVNAGESVGTTRSITRLLGRRLAHDEIRSPLGCGGMGEVYKAKDRKLERGVAVKVATRVCRERRERAPPLRR